MLTVIIGATGAGKSTLAQRLISDANTLIPAGGWARRATGIYGHSVDDAAKLAAYTTQALERNPRAAVEWIQQQIAETDAPEIIVEGVRNPGDLLELAPDKVIDVGGAGVNDWERDGLQRCRDLRGFLAVRGCTWVDYPRRFLVPLLADVQVHALPSWLGKAQTEHVAGRILALECYPGSPVTAAFQSDDGGRYHDLPFQAFGNTVSSHVIAEASNPVIEPPLGSRACTVFRQDGTPFGTGYARAMLHWPSGNTLAHLVQLDSGSVALVPSHKILFGIGCVKLPRWDKNRHVPHVFQSDPAGHCTTCELPHSRCLYSEKL